MLNVDTRVYHDGESCAQGRRHVTYTFGFNPERVIGRRTASLWQDASAGPARRYSSQHETIWMAARRQGQDDHNAAAQ